jgi:hypothetical protein
MKYGILLDSTVSEVGCMPRSGRRTYTWSGVPWLRDALTHDGIGGRSVRGGEDMAVVEDLPVGRKGRMELCQ